MFILKKIEAENFKRFKNISVPFKEDYILILGENNDFEGTSSNGAGKSSVVSLVSFTLTGKTIEQSEDLITLGESKGFTRVYLESKSLGYYCVERILKKGSSTKIKIYNYDPFTTTITKELYTQNTNVQKQQIIYDILSIKGENAKACFNVFTNSCYFDPDEVNIFLSKEVSNKDKLDFFSKYFDLENYEKSSLLCNEYIKQISSEIETHSDKISVFKDSIVDQIELDGEYLSIPSYLKYLNSVLESKKSSKSLLQTQLQQVRDKEHLQRSHDSLVAKTEQQIRKLSSTRKELESKKYSIEDVREKIVATLKNQITVEEVEACKEELTAKESEMLNISSEVRRLEDAINNSNKVLSCPHCDGGIVIRNGQLHVASQDKDYKRNLMNELEVKEQELTIVKQDIFKLRSKIDSSKELSRKLEHQNDTLALLEESVANINNVIEELTESIRENKEEIESLKESLSKIQGDPDDIKRKLDDVEGAISALNTEIGATTKMQSDNEEYHQAINLLTKKVNELNEKISSYRFWAKGFRQIKSKILEQSFATLEAATNDYLKMADMPYTLEINTLQATKQGDSTKMKLTINVCDIDGEVRDLESYSKGEKTRIMLFLLLSLKSIIKTNLGFTIYDEYLNLIDNKGVDKISKILCGISGQNIVITNSDWLRDVWGGSKLLVSRNNGVSTVKYIN